MLRIYSDTGMHGPTVNFIIWELKGTPSLVDAHTKSASTILSADWINLIWKEAKVGRITHKFNNQVHESTLHWCNNLALNHLISLDLLSSKNKGTYKKITVYLSRVIQDWGKHDTTHQFVLKVSVPALPETSSNSIFLKGRESWHKFTH